jgi:hypothetical protein
MRRQYLALDYEAAVRKYPPFLKLPSDGGLQSYTCIFNVLLLIRQHKPFVLHLFCSHCTIETVAIKMVPPTTGLSAKRAPDLNMPKSDKAVTVKIINTTAFMRTTAINTFMHPTYKGHEVLTGPALSFLVEHEEAGRIRRLVFDLGLRKDWKNLAPSFVAYLSDGTWDLHTEQNVQDILEKGY